MIGNAAPLKVLVVDDEPAIRRFLRTSLTAQGYQVIEAEDGTGALEHLRRSTVDILVLDLGLPDINGLEIIERLRNQGSPLPIIVLSSRTDEAGKVKALDLGADDYVTKPFGIDELLARIRAALRHRLQQEGEQPVFRCGELSMDLVRRIVYGRRQRGEADAAGIRFAPVVRRACREGADAQIYPARAMGRRRRRAVSARLYPGAASEDRTRPRAASLYSDRAGCRLPHALSGLIGCFQLYCERSCSGGRRRPHNPATRIRHPCKLATSRCYCASCPSAPQSSWASAARQSLRHCARGKCWGRPASAKE